MKKLLILWICALSVELNAQEIGSVLNAVQLQEYYSGYTLDNFIEIKNKDDKYGVANKEGKVIIPFSCNYDMKLDEGIFLVYQNIAGKYGYVYIDTLGNHLNNEVYEQGEAFSQGYAIVTKTEYEMGLINRAGKEIIPCSKDHYSVFDYSEGAVVISPPEGDRYMYLEDTTGKVLLKSTEDLEIGISGLHNGLIVVYNRKKGKSGYCDKTGKILIPCSYDVAMEFSEGMAGVSINKKFGFIDKTGKMVISPKYYGVGKFSEGLADVYIGTEDNFKMGFVDKTGNLVIPAIYSSLIDPFKNGVALVKDDKDNMVYIDKTGKIKE